MNQSVNKVIAIEALGLLPYPEATQMQKQLFDSIIDIKIKNRGLATDSQLLTPNYLITLQHPHVYTLGKSGAASNLLVNEAFLANIGATYFETGRGGDITYHGPGQIVAYPILDLDNFFTDIHKYLRVLEEAVILSCATYDIIAGRIDGLTGVWVENRKICAIGVKTSRWVTMHGLAFNVNTDLSYFKHIVPCGITDKAVTSLQQEVGKPIPIAEVTERLIHFFIKLMGASL